MNLEALLEEVFDDFPTYCSLLDIRLKRGGLAPFHWEQWHPEQQLFEQNRTGRDIIVKPRQVGFSTMELARDLHFAVTREGVQVLVVAHEKKLAEELFLGLKIMYRALKRHGLAPATSYNNVRELVFADLGSAVRVVEAGSNEASAKNKGRSGAIHRLHATEVAFWGAAHTTMAALMGAMDVDSEVVIESTAYGVGGLFYDDVMAAREGRSGYKLHFFPWYGHSRYRRPVPEDFDPAPRDEWEEKLRERGCDDQQIAWWRAKVDDPKSGGLDKVLGEYPIDLDTCFRATGRFYIEPRFVDAIADRVRDPIRVLPITAEGRSLGEALVYVEPREGRRYVVGADVAEGVGKDASTMVVLDRDTGEVCACYWSDSVDEGDLGLALSFIGLAYNRALVGPERNNGGRATLRALQAEARYPNLYYHEDGKPGWPTNTATRPVLFDELAQGIKDRSLWTPDARMLGEAKTLVRDKDGKPRARDKGNEGGCQDDTFVAWGIAQQLRSRGGRPIQPFSIPGL